MVKDKDGYYIVKTGTKNYVDAASMFTYRSYVGNYTTYEVVDGDPYIVATGPLITSIGDTILPCGKSVVATPATKTITNKTLLARK